MRQDMYRRLGSLAFLGLAVFGVFLVFGLDVRSLDDLWAALGDLWSLIRNLGGDGVNAPSMPKPPRINLPAPNLPG